MQIEKILLPVPAVYPKYLENDFLSKVHFGKRKSLKSEGEYASFARF